MLKRFVLFVHRWLGVACCLFFLMWFPSGIGMMYWDFPAVTADDRLEHAPPLDPSAVRVSPAEAYAALGQSPSPDEVRLSTFDGRPVYRFRQAGQEAVVYADTGARQVEVSNALMRRIASDWTGQSAASGTVEQLDRVDQWTVEGSFRRLRPLWKYSWPTGQQVYVSAASGEVVQYTTTASRLGAYLGPIPHWLYFTPLRSNQPRWSRVVIGSSGAAAIAALLGIVIGIWIFSPSRRYQHGGAATSIPYRGPKRWHMALGLIFGAGAVTWAFSGMLSMDPFPGLESERASPARERDEGANIRGTLRGPLSMAAFGPRHPREALAAVAGLHVKELELAAVAGVPVYIAMLEQGNTRVLTLAGETRTEFDRTAILETIARAAGPGGLADLRELTQYDRYYLDRHRRRPLPVLLARLNDAAHTRYYIDPRTARIVGSYSSHDWTSRWLYHGLHSLDFPWLYNHRPAWDIVVISFMLGGTALGVTSLILAWRVVGRMLRATDSR